MKIKGQTRKRVKSKSECCWHVYNIEKSIKYQNQGVFYKKRAKVNERMEQKMRSKEWETNRFKTFKWRGKTSENGLKI